jgi:signal transduction histidine kinase
MDMDKSLSQDVGGELRKRYEEALSQLRLIGRINELVALLDDIPSLCLSIGSIILEFTAAENCSIMLYDSDSKSLRLFVAKGKGDGGSFLGTDKADTRMLGLGEGIAGLVAKREKIICVDDCESDERFVELKAASKKVVSLISAPIVSDDEVFGVINCSHSQKGAFGEIDKANVAKVADHVAVLLRRVLVEDHADDRLHRMRKEFEEKNEYIEKAKTRQTELQKQLYRSEKLVTLGEIIAGIAHELNNRVAPILIYSQMLQQSAHSEQEIKRLRIVEESAKGAKAILGTLLSYSRDGSQGKEVVNVNQILHNALTLSEYRLSNNGVELAVDISPQLPPAKVNEKQFVQVFLNLINNAIHAMEPAGGKLSIRSLHTDNNIQIIIADSGRGIPDKIAASIFDPFFTTKEAGKGTGLGLSISKKYIEENGGSIRSEASSLGGAAFVIEIPGIDIATVGKSDVKTGAPGNGSNGDGTSGKTETLSAKILVVDDDTAIQNAIRDILGPSYDVEFASDGHDATYMIEKKPFDLLLVDYHMPGFDGKQLYEWIVGNRPSLKNRVVFSTGDTYHENIRDFIASTGCKCLIKPFTTKNLREMVASTLDS